MKTIWISLILFVINFLSLCGIATLSLQDYLTMLVYIVPILLEFVLALLWTRKNYLKCKKILIGRLLIFCVLLLLIIFYLLLTSEDVTDILAVSAFAIFFNILPYLFGILCFHLCTKDKAGQEKNTGDGSNISK